jgi:hypothetical protein
MQRAAAHEARGYEHAERGNGRAANAHFARARQLRSAFGARIDDAYDRVADQIVRAYNARRKTKLTSLPHAIDMLAEELRRVFRAGAPICSTLGLERSDRVLLADARKEWGLELQLGESNGGFVYHFSDAGDYDFIRAGEKPAWNKRRFGEYEPDDSEPGARKRVDYEDGEAAMES